MQNFQTMKRRYFAKLAYRYETLHAYVSQTYQKFTQFPNNKNNPDNPEIPHQYTCDTLKPYHHSFASYKSPCQIMATSLNAFYLPMVVKAEDFLSPTAQLLQLRSWLLDGLNVMP